MTAGPAAGVAAGRREVADRSARWFREWYGRGPEEVWFAPGRVNLVGEHTDYNEGFVLPFALGQGVVAAAARREDDVLALRTRRDPGASVEIPLERLRPGSGRSGPGGTVPGPSGSGLGGTGLGGPPPGVRDDIPGWARYPAGVAWSLLSAGYPVAGVSLAIDSCLADGAGLSSSAALECSVALALTELEGAGGVDGGGIPRCGLAAIARRAENEFVGVPSGIMDQSAALLCVADHALLLDCQSLEFSQVPFAPAAAGVRVLVIDTRAKHELTDGEYGGRQTECHEAARRLGVPSLRWVTDLSELAALDDPILVRRARHVITDNQRVQEVAALLRRSGGGDARALAEVGALLTQSHRSLRDDFEVSWPEADVAVDAAVAAGALGARMTGGGFGGSAIALVPDTRAAQVEAAIQAAYADRGWTEPEFLTAVPSDAAQRMH
jgi:galactokinase